jgi:hypothetical protein
MRILDIAMFLFVFNISLAIISPSGINLFGNKGLIAYEDTTIITGDINATIREQTYNITQPGAYKEDWLSGIVYSAGILLNGLSILGSIFLNSTILVGPMLSSTFHLPLSISLGIEGIILLIYGIGIGQLLTGRDVRSME